MPEKFDDRAAEFLPTAAAEVLRLRANLLRRLREFFDQRNFLEVETPLLSADTVVDAHIDPVGLTLPNDPRRPRQGRKLWLQTSPEFHMKRMLASGQYEAIYQVTKSFRVGEQGAAHNPEFTIAEWYRVGDRAVDGRQLLCELCTALLDTQPAERISYREAFLELAGVDPLGDSDARLRECYVSCVAASNVGETGSLSRDELLNLFLADVIQPHLGRDRPTILYHYPASQAALAKVSIDAHGNPVAERFELFVDGVELANGYDELLDPDELLQRNELHNQIRIADGREELPFDSRLIAAMRHGLPACSGTALGFDRVVMLAAGATQIEEVLAFPVDRA